MHGWLPTCKRSSRHEGPVSDTWILGTRQRSALVVKESGEWPIQPVLCCVLAALIQAISSNKLDEGFRGFRLAAKDGRSGLDPTRAWRRDDHGESTATGGQAMQWQQQPCEVPKGVDGRREGAG